MPSAVNDPGKSAGFGTSSVTIFTIGVLGVTAVPAALWRPLLSSVVRVVDEGLERIDFFFVLRQRLFCARERALAAGRHEEVFYITLQTYELLRD